MISIDNLLNPDAGLALIPILLVFFFLLFYDFVGEDSLNKKERSRFRIVMLIMRGVIFLLLVLALAKPFGEVSVSTPGDPKVIILVDNSTSMELFDTTFLAALKKELEMKIPLSVRYIGTGTESAIGEHIITYLEKDTNLLLVSDGNANSGPMIEDAALLAANLNSTLSSIKLESTKKEVGVYVSGPESAVKGVNTSFTVTVINTANQQATVTVSVDDQEVISQTTDEKQFSFQQTFEEGTHKIIARVSAAQDHFEQNNVFYKTVTVVKKPKILYIANSQDYVETIFNELYDVTSAKSIPEDVDKYYAIILNDMPANVPGVERLANYLIDKEGGFYGNGLFVIGGFDSFDRGNYKGSLLESYLPVYVGKAARQRGASNIVLSIDFSGTTGERYEVVRDPSTGQILEYRKITSNVQDVNKALAISVINSLGPDNNVGASIFSTQSATVQELAPLFRIKKELIDKISRIDQPAGQSYFHLGLSGAYLLLKDNVGSNNIIMITDGVTGSAQLRQETLDYAKTLNSRGVRVYIVGTGRNVDEDFLKDIAYNGGGIYFPASQENNLRVLFGEPEESKFGEVFDLFILNQYHFITQGLELDGSLYGFNQVIPKTNALLLVTTQHGEPAVTVWNYGLGRVATLNVFSGNNNLGDLLNKRNSILLTRITNWVIGDPQRKEDYYVVIDNARTGKLTDVIVKSDKYPTAQGVSFTKNAENIYKTTITAQDPGFEQFLGKEYAVNYDQEYQALGVDTNMEDTILMTGGKVFEPDQGEEIAEFIKSVSRRDRIEKTTIIWPFLLAAAIIFLIELTIRKIREYNLNR